MTYRTAVLDYKKTLSEFELDVLHLLAVHWLNSKPPTRIKLGQTYANFSEELFNSGLHIKFFPKKSGEKIYNSLCKFDTAWLPGVGCVHRLLIIDGWLGEEVKSPLLKKGGLAAHRDSCFFFGESEEIGKATSFKKVNYSFHNYEVARYCLREIGGM